MNILSKLKQWLPKHCLICEQSNNSNKSLCYHCWQSLPWQTDCCQLCNLTLVKNKQIICGPCQQHPPAFKQMITACRYEKPIAHFISAFKFHHQLRYRQLLAEILLAKIPDHCRPDIILPIPLHKRRLQKRGFNQAVEIAKLISKTMQIPISTNEVIRTLNTQPQTALKIPERHKNIKKAFAITKPMHYTTVAILDDVITTGATVSAMANCLQQAGIKTVYVLGVARTYR